jgi:hypothetical protein
MVVAGVENEVVRLAGRVMEQYGTRLASITLDETGRVFACTSHPHITDLALAGTVADRIAEQLYADLSCR